MGAVPRVCQVLLALNVIVFVAQQLDATVASRFALIPPYVADGEWYRLLTSAFLHDGLIHIGCNMALLWWVGSELERALGWARFLALYLVAGLGGAAASYVLSPLNIAALGASGAVFGLFGAYVVVARRVGADASRVYMLIGVNLLLGFSLPNIDYWAHIGGLATGAAVGAAYAHMPQGRGQWVRQAAVVGVVVVALVAVVAVRTDQITRHLGLAFGH
jgi:membrane associated rhomboid family serine protease